MFHHTLMLIADHFAGVSERNSAQYSLIYRSVEHRTLKALCVEVRRTAPSSKYARLVPAGGWNGNLQEFATAVTDLQDKRHSADYDPIFRFKTEEAKAAIRSARSAVQRMQSVQVDHRVAFLTLLLCPPR